MYKITNIIALAKAHPQLVLPDDAAIQKLIESGIQYIAGVEILPIADAVEIEEKPKKKKYHAE